MNSDPCLGNLKMRGALTVGTKVILVLHCDWPVLPEFETERKKVKGSVKVSNGHNGPSQEKAGVQLTHVCANGLSGSEEELQQEEDGVQL